MSNIEQFVWEESLSVGYSEIDLHHKKLLSIISQLHNLLQLPHSEYKLKIGKVIKNLSDYTEYHFSEEEKLMQKYGYPQLEEHAAIHKSFIDKIKTHLIPLASGDIEIGVEFYSFLGKWLIQHIAVTDKKWANFIHTNYPEV